MKQFCVISFLCACCFSFTVSFAGSVWHRVPGKNSARTQLTTASSSLAYTLDEYALRTALFAFSTDAALAQTIELPLPDGTSRYFKVWASPLMPTALAAKYPELKTFTGVATDNPNVTAKLDFTSFGFHAIIFDGDNSSFIDPADNVNSGYYTVHYKRNETRKYEEHTRCLVAGQATASAQELAAGRRKMSARTTNGYQLRTYRLALSCDHQYAQAATGTSTPTIVQVLSKMVTSLNRINGVYERELSVSMNLVANEDTLIFPTATGSINGNDPFSTIDAIAYRCLDTNQKICDLRIGNANYDIGHVFTTGAGGLSQVGVVCQAGFKAQSVTGQPSPVGDGFDIDYVAHEMGHEFGADHPFNNGIDGSCANGNINAPTAYEPGSGSTIMAYAGICAPDDLQPHSDAYFHSVSLQQIQSYITAGGDGCAVKTATSNKLVGLTGFSASYTIPFLTPFELSAPTAVDSVSDSTILYCWEQWDLGDLGFELINTHDAGPIFRSYDPTTSVTRVFPRINMVLAGVLSDAGNEDAEGEKAADVARYLTFKLTLRDIYHGFGCFLIPDDSIHLDVLNTGEGFKVTSQNTSGLIFATGTTQTVTWNVVSTNTAPISADSVDIFLSADGGYTWPIRIGTFLNNGSAAITIPPTDTTITAARIKVKGTGNVFFNVNSTDFQVIQAVDIHLFPIPAGSVVHITTGTSSPVEMVIHNTLGQLVWKGAVIDNLDLPVSLWARGTYFLRTTDVQNKHTVKKFVLD